MREINFRGRGHDGTWHYGWLVPTDTGDGFAILFGPMCLEEYQEVEPYTVGQFTGLLDVDGREIYEGDVVAFGDFTKEHDIKNEYYRDVVKWDNSHARFILDVLPFDDVFSNELLILGNVHDSPELVEDSNGRL